MGFSVDHPVIKRHNTGVIRKEEEQILQCFTEEEALHLVPVLRISGVHYIVNGGVSPFLDFCVLVEGLENFPTPFLILCVVGESVEIEERLHCFWPEEVVSIQRLHTEGGGRREGGRGSVNQLEVDK